MSTTVSTSTRTLKLGPDVTLDLITTGGSEFVGIGQIRIAGVDLRSNSRPFLIRCDTPDGILYTRLELADVTPPTGTDDTTRVELNALGLPWARGEYCDEYSQPLTFPSHAPQNVIDKITLILKPITLTLGGKSWTGFSYAFEFKSDTRKIHRFMTHATWEIGGNIAGNTVLHQGQCNMPVYHGAKDAQFTTTCLKTLDRYGDLQGVSYQLAPRGGLIQAFDFQHAKQGALLMYWPLLESISSHIDSPIGCDVLHVLDETRFDLSNHVVTPTKHVLFAPGDLPEHEARDLWWNAYEHVYGGIRSRYGVVETKVLPEVSLRYRTRVHQGGLKMTIAGHEVDSQQVPYAVADYVFPLLAARGIRRFFPEVMSESDVTQLGMKRKLDGGVHGDLHCSSVCATHRFQPAEFWGGMKAWKYMADKARTLGIELGAWFAPHFSPRAGIYQEHPEYQMIAVTSAVDGGGYGFSTIVVADWNTGIYQWVLDDFKRWKNEAGLDYIFTDSWANMGLLQMNYSKKMRSNFARLGDLYQDFQKIGIAAHSFEGISPFGYSRFGVADLRGESREASQGIVGQNDFGWWIGQENMAYNICPMVNYGNRRPDDKWEQVQFRLMANRSVGCFEHLYDDKYNMVQWWIDLNKIYLQSVTNMKSRRLLANDAGVMWTDKNTQIIWAFKQVDIGCHGAKSITQLTPDGEGRKVLQTGTFTTNPWSVYKITL